MRSGMMARNAASGMRRYGSRARCMERGYRRMVVWWRVVVGEVVVVGGKSRMAARLLLVTMSARCGLRSASPGLDRVDQEATGARRRWVRPTWNEIGVLRILFGEEGRRCRSVNDAR